MRIWRNQAGIATWQLLLAMLMCGGLTGCASFWDDVTSRDFEFKSFFKKPDPFLVLQNSTDGDKRAKSLRALGELKDSGGTQQEQDKVENVLITAAASEKQFLARLAAIESLGRFHDSRAVAGLTTAYSASASFTPDLAARVRSQAVTALGETGNPEAVPFLVKIMKGNVAEGTDQEKQQIMDVRMAAARALGHFKGYATTDALVSVLRTEKDVALCDTAYASLQANTGQQISPDFKDFDNLLRSAKEKENNPSKQPERTGILAMFQWPSGY